MRSPLIGLAAALASGVLLGACSDDSSAPSAPTSNVEFRNLSNAPALAKSLIPGVQIYSLIASDDTLPQSPSYIFGGSADGAGVLRNPDGNGYTIVVNHEDNFAVSRITLDDTFRPVKGEYLLSSTFGLWRLCSATLATPEVHGFGPTFLTVGESNEESMIHAVDPLGAINNTTLARGLGKWNGEQALPLPIAAYPGKTVIVIGDDDSSVEGGNVGLYVSNTVGDLQNGKLYIMRRVDQNTRERDIVLGSSYDVEFVEVPNATFLSGRQINQFAASINAPRMARMEDVDYRKGSAERNRELYFTATGQNYSGTNADSSRTKYGRVYRLRLNAADPAGRGTIEVVMDGDVRPGPVDRFQNPDNIYVGENYVYVQEDANSYGDETHDAFIWQYEIGTRAVRPVIELDHRRAETDANRFNLSRTGSGSTATYNPNPSTFGSWEYGAMVDLRETTGRDGFLVAIQPHTWRGLRYQGVDGGALRATEDQASQLVVISGLPR